MIKNSLTLDEINKYFYEDNGVLCWKIRKARCIEIGDPAGCVSKRKIRNTNYIVVELDDKGYFVHRLLYQIYNNIFDLPKHLVIDHIDKNGLNNSKDNLRLVTESQNRANITKQSKNSGYKGVHWGKKERKWKAQIGFQGVNYYLGCFDNILDAARKYDEYAIKFFGDHSSLNFPKQNYNNTGDELLQLDYKVFDFVDALKIISLERNSNELYDSVYTYYDSLENFSTKQFFELDVNIPPYTSKYKELPEHVQIFINYFYSKYYEIDGEMFIFRIRK